MKKPVTAHQVIVGELVCRPAGSTLKFAEVLQKTENGAVLLAWGYWLRQWYTYKSFTHAHFYRVGIICQSPLGFILEEEARCEPSKTHP